MAQHKKHPPTPSLRKNKFYDFDEVYLSAFREKKFWISYFLLLLFSTLSIWAAIKTELYGTGIGIPCAIATFACLFMKHYIKEKNAIWLPLHLINATLLIIIGGYAIYLSIYATSLS